MIFALKEGPIYKKRVLNIILIIILSYNSKPYVAWHILACSIYEKIDKYVHEHLSPVSDNYKYESPIITHTTSQRQTLLFTKCKGCF